MRTNLGGTLATLVLTAPLAAIPLMAILGVPQLTNSSGSPDTAEPAAANSPPATSGNRSSEPAAWKGEPAGAFSESVSRASGLQALSGERTPGPVVFSTGDDSSDQSVDQQRRTSPAPGAEITSGESRPFGRAASDFTVEADAPRRSAERDSLWRTAAQQLQDLGIEDYRLEPGQRPGWCVFVCQFVPGPDSRIVRRFEAEAVEPIDAIQNVLAQIDDWRRQTGAAFLQSR